MNTKLTGRFAYATKVFTANKIAALAAPMLAATVLLNGCASTPAPTNELATSKSAIDSASSAGAAEYAPVELKTAREKYERAQQLVAKQDDYPVAKRLAEQAAADAKLAETRAEAAKAQKSVEETQKGQRALQEEMQRQEP